MNVIQKHILSVGLVLAGFAVGATSIVAVTEAYTHDKIIENERQTLLSAINALVDSSEYNNDILTDVITLPKTQQLATKEETTVYRARHDGAPVAAVFTSIAPNGYSGSIKLLVGVYNDGTLAGVRVINHKETPGLGDKINENKTNWILKFKGLSLTNPTDSQWAVKKDGGEFDQFTGATITPRAVVTAVKRSLQFFEQNRDELFKETK
ncbi:MAG: electron transport complex subunit RsxG [Pseudomonadota bacterium]|nr:electron transport complex subunit RsxG [Pseudomonadota bacterium]MDO7666977.1 electron transport complex subunit RsxG [Pseudomonadota bacterium]MDO7710198.1 electron transport complex subunit RsxG [Pseudomonadota bacterium]